MIIYGNNAEFQTIKELCRRYLVKTHVVYTVYYSRVKDENGKDSESKTYSYSTRICMICKFDCTFLFPEVLVRFK